MLVINDIALTKREEYKLFSRHKHDLWGIMEYIVNRDPHTQVTIEDLEILQEELDEEERM